jgi:hypothetical protein
MKPIIRIHNMATDEVIDREMTDEEYAEHLKQKAKDDAIAEAKAQALAAKAAAEAKLAALGLTADDLKALGLGGNGELTSMPKSTYDEMIAQREASTL